MKKTLLLIASAALLLAGCAKEKTMEKSAVLEGEETYSFTVGLGAETKGSADDDGKAAEVNHWVMEVLDSDKERYTYQEHDGQKGVKTHTFNVKLIKGQTYTVLFWADTKGAYVTTDLRNVTLANTSTYAANLDSRDAFSAVKTGFSTVEASSQEITLTRPLAQLNVVFTDLKDLYETMGSVDEYAKFKPGNFVVKAKVPTSFNVLDQTAGAPATTALTMTAATNYLDNYSAHGEKATLYMDYFFASAGQKDLVDIDFSFVSKGVGISHIFTSIPFQRNYRTNILGNFMSADAEWKVKIDPIWTGEYNPEFVKEGSVEAANKALKEGKTAISITNPEDASTSVVLPVETDGKDVSITVSGAPASTQMLFETESGAQGPANLYLNTDAESLSISCPSSHVVLNKGNYSSVKATTSSSTLVVGKDVTVDSLKVTQGNIEIHGKVAKLTRENGVKAKMYASDRATLINYINWAKSGDVAGLETDIDLAGENWTPLYPGEHFAATFDGQGHTISNLQIADYNGAYIGFISTVSGATIKNVTFKDATLTNAASLGGNARGAVIVGWSYACNIDNCHIINASITGCQKVAGILGTMSVEGAAGLNSVTNCSVENLTISCNIENDLFQSGALIGYIQLVNPNPDGILIENNSVKDITFNDDCSDYGNISYYNGTFIGTIIRKQKIDGQKIILNNNTVSGTNTELFKTIYTSPYFGWTTNVENYSGAIAPIIIDGEEWEPDYPLKKDSEGNYHIIRAEGLLQFHDLYAAGKVAYTAKVYLEDDIDFTDMTWTTCDWHADNATKGFALFDGKNHSIKNFTIEGQGMFSRWACTANIGGTPYFKDIVFDGVKNVTSTLNVSLFCGQCYQDAKIENVTIKNSQFEGTYKVAPFVGSVYDENGRQPILTLKDCKVENTTVTGTFKDRCICGMVAWVNEQNKDKIAFEGDNVVKDVTLYINAVDQNKCAKIYHNDSIAYDEAENVTVTNVNVVIAQ